jgi:protein-glutamine gamma-glutamyltransferase
MLKQPIRSEAKESIILLIYAWLMSDALMAPTIIFVVFGAILSWINKRPSKLMTNILTLVVFISYWAFYGKVIDPEVGINFLTTIIVLKQLEREHERDRYMTFFGIILLIAAGSLFIKSLTYVAFFTLSFFTLVYELYRHLKLELHLKSFLTLTFWVLPFTSLLFILAPRMMSPFNIPPPLSEGEVGYTPEVNFSNIEKLQYNNRPVFHAMIKGGYQKEHLYWRGNTLSFTDGWNWPIMPQNRVQKIFLPDQVGEKSGIHQSIRLLNQHAFFFGLDQPHSVSTYKGVAVLDATRTLAQVNWQPYLKYEVVSRPGNIVDERKNLGIYLRASLENKDREWIRETFKASELPYLQRDIQEYMQRESFSYSLSPGKINSFSEFMQHKKTGYCAHYASAIALILRVKGIPSRLVSGFLGGTYNKYADHFLITQNDAHVWIEAYHQGSWQRLDPTTWIAPERIQMGGEAFIERIINTDQHGIFKHFNFRLLNELNQWFNQWDITFYKWLEDLDYQGQEELFTRFQFKRKWLYFVIPLLMLVFLALYWPLVLSGRKAARTEIEGLWHLFGQRLKKRGLDLNFCSIQGMEDQIKKSAIGDQDHVLELKKLLVLATFDNESVMTLNVLRKKIRKI